MTTVPSDPGRISVLGPIQCIDATGRVHPLTGHVARVAAWLVAHRGESVATTTVCSVVWPEPGGAPADSGVAAGRLVRQAASELSRVPDVTVAQRPGRVTLQTSPGRVDADVVTHLVQALRAAPHASTADAVHDELRRWRGEPFPELDDRVGEIPEAFRLLELRHEATLRLLAIRATGPADLSLVADVTALVVERPDDAGARYLLAVALHRAGCRAEALRAIQECRQLSEAHVCQVNDLESSILDGTPFEAELDIGELL